MHTIRLRGPWQLEPVARFVQLADGSFALVDDNLPGEARVTMPADWADSFGAEFMGRVRYHRVFQTPTGLDDGERVFLVVEPPRSRGIVRLADDELGEVVAGGPPGRFEITGRLADHNRLEIIVEYPAPGASSNATEAGGLVGEVRLEIEDDG